MIRLHLDRGRLWSWAPQPQSIRNIAKITTRPLSAAIARIYAPACADNGCVDGRNLQHRRLFQHAALRKSGHIQIAGVQQTRCAMQNQVRRQASRGR